MFVLDASVAAAWIFPDEVNEYSEAILSLLQREEALVPVVWPLEVANLLLVAERRQRIREAQIAQVYQFLHDLPVQVAGSAGLASLRSVMTIGRRYQLSAYDASYLELAMSGGLALATQDVRLRAAMEAAGVRLA